MGRRQREYVSEVLLSFPPASEIFRSTQIAIWRCKTQGRQGRKLGASVVVAAPLPATETGNGNYSIPREPRQIKHLLYR